MRKIKGYSVIEVLVVIGVFAILSVIAAQSIIITLRSQKKNDSLINVKGEIDFAANIIERNLQTASYIIVNPVTVCDGATATPSIGFSTPYGGRGDFACLDISTIGGGTNFYNLTTPDIRVASSSGIPIRFSQRLTTNNLEITSCSFTCLTLDEKSYVTFTISASAKNIPASDDNIVSTSRQVFIRSSKRE
ncbi:MAG TPA: type II secretion system protein [Patescibacteria group bacterium]|nr:type II secretion system protein [Patescibacteria group bacterium]